MENIKCSDIGFGTYNCAYTVMLPYFVKCLYEENIEDFTDKMVAIDKCLLTEITELWKMGIKTTGCCCGHGDVTKCFIGVKEEYIPQMKEMGYKVFFNSIRPEDEDSFVPKTNLKYGDIPYSEFSYADHNMDVTTEQIANVIYNKKH